jgi:hypothetical protein
MNRNLLKDHPDPVFINQLTQAAKKLFDHYRHLYRLREGVDARKEYARRQDELLNWELYRNVRLAF